GLSHEAPTLLDFFGEIYSSAAKNLDFMRVCESVVMNIGTRPVTVVDTISATVIFYFSLVLGAYRMKWVFSDHFRLRTN
ncbi:hypothetical protein, partial [Faecousia sp.]|uniref:hypothetical protein n=1 Tax=Faecousia sp. TaxID=2952921 RepID=UPI003AB1FA8A